jgi:hypothetical protein
MSDQDKHELILKQLDDLRIESVTIRIASRRSVRTVGQNGDEYRTAESEAAWTITQPNPELGPMTVDLAHAAALKFSPILIRKVFFDLVVAGVLRKEDAEARIAYANSSYANALKVKKLDGSNPTTTSTQTDTGTDRPDLRGTGDALSASGEDPSEGSVLHSGEDRGMPSEDGPSHGPPDAGSTSARTDQDERPQSQVSSETGS